MQIHALLLALVVLSAWILALPGLASSAHGDEAAKSGSVTKGDFGKTPDGEAVELYVLQRVRSPPRS